MANDIAALLKRIPRGMLGFITDRQDAAYTDKEVATCMTILHAYLAEVDRAENTTAGMQAVKVAVLKLNDLNERCEYELIETDQRENIWELMQTAFLEKAFVVPDSGDITDEWREW